VRCDELYEEAVRRSLSLDWQDLIVAKRLCQLILADHDAASVRATVLLDKVIRAEEAAWDVHQQDRLHGAGMNLSKGYLMSLFSMPLLCVLVGYLLGYSVPTRIIVSSVLLIGFGMLVLGKSSLATSITVWVLFEPTLMGESAHIAGIYASGAVRNLRGRRMPITRMFRYLEVEGRPFLTGIREAAEKSRREGVIHVPPAAVNLSQMQRDWNTSV